MSEQETGADWKLSDYLDSLVCGNKKEIRDILTMFIGQVEGIREIEGFA